jgi:Flp pilus assembly protein TadD
MQFPHWIRLALGAAVVAPARLKLAETCLRQGNGAGALAEAVRAADLLPKDADAQLKAGALRLAAGRAQNALARADKALAINPRHVDALVLRANAQAAKAELPDHPAVNDTLALVSIRKQLGSLGIPLLRLAVEQRPGEPVFHYHLGLAYSKAGDKAAARQALKLKADFEGAGDARKLLRSLG